MAQNTNIHFYFLDMAQIAYIFLFLFIFFRGGGVGRLRFSVQITCARSTHLRRTLDGTSFKSFRVYAFYAFVCKLYHANFGGKKVAVYLHLILVDRYTFTAGANKYLMIAK